MTGSMSVQLDDDHPRLDISEGHIVRLFWRRIGQGGWQEVWTMRLGGPLENTGVQTDVKANSMTFQMADDLTLLAKSLRSFRYRRPAVGRAAFSRPLARSRAGSERRASATPFGAHRRRRLRQMGLEPAWKSHECVLVSDGGAPFE